MIAPVERDLVQAFRRRVRHVVEEELEREGADAERLRRQVVPAASQAVAHARAAGRCGRAWLFGSFAWGGATSRSDVDVLVEHCADPDELAAELWRVCDRPVHVVELDKAPATLRERVLREGVPI